MKTFKSLVVCLSLLVISQATFAQGTKIGVINAMQALSNSDAAGVMTAELEQNFSVDQARATELNDELATMAENFQQNEAVMTDEEKRRAESDAQELQVQLQLIGERIQAAIQARQQEFIASMQGDLAEAVTDVVAEGGYDLILNFDSVPYLAPVLDITAKVTAKLNEKFQRSE